MEPRCSLSDGVFVYAVDGGERCFEGELILGLQAGDDGAKDEFEHPFMLY